jgi:hypothetical protein
MVCTALCGLLLTTATTVVNIVCSCSGNTNTHKLGVKYGYHRYHGNSRVRRQETGTIGTSIAVNEEGARYNIRRSHIRCQFKRILTCVGAVPI